MCSTIRPSEKGPLLQVLFQPSIFVMPQPVTFTKSCFLVELSTVAQRSKPSISAGLLAPKQGPIVSDSCQPSILVMPEPAAVYGVIAQSGTEIEALQVCSTIRPPKKGPIV